MKCLVLAFFFIFLSLTGKVSAQERRNDILIIYRHLNPTTTLLRKSDSLWFKTDSLQPFKRILVTGISKDTIFYKGGFVTKSQLYSIKAVRFEIPKFFDLSKWRIAVPPGDVYKSEEMLRAFRFWIVHNSSPDGSYNENAWQFSDYYHKSAVLTMREKREKEVISYEWDTLHENFFKFDLTRLFFMQVMFAYEFRFTPKYSIEIEAGYQFRNSDIPRPQTDPVPLFPLEGPVFTLGPKLYYLSHSRPFIYCQPQLLFKYVYFYKQWDLSEVTHGYGEFQDQRRTVFGMSLNFGTMKTFGQFFIDFTWGIGFKYASINQVLYYRASQPTNNPAQFIYYNPSHLPVTRESYKWNFLLNVLFKIGVSF